MCFFVGIGHFFGNALAQFARHELAVILPGKDLHHGVAAEFGQRILEQNRTAVQVISIERALCRRVAFRPAFGPSVSQLRSSRKRIS